MRDIERLLDNNRRWVEQMTANDPEYFSKMAERQEPHYLFIGCSDSRVSTNAITGTAPGEMFVHRNIANQVFRSDINLLSVLQYAVEILDVKHLIVCGHYNCGGIKAAMGTADHGLVDNWLGTIRDVMRWNAAELNAIEDETKRVNRLVELNVIQQVYNLSRTPCVQQAWNRGPRPLLTGLVYDLREGLLRPLVVGVDSNEKAHELFHRQGEHTHAEGRRSAAGPRPAEGEKVALRERQERAVR